jgi:hypothetical protein
VVDIHRVLGFSRVIWSYPKSGLGGDCHSYAARVAEVYAWIAPPRLAGAEIDVIRDHAEYTHFPMLAFTLPLSEILLKTSNYYFSADSTFQELDSPAPLIFRRVEGKGHPQAGVSYRRQVS